MASNGQRKKIAYEFAFVQCKWALILTYAWLGRRPSWRRRREGRNPETPASGYTSRRSKNTPSSWQPGPKCTSSTDRWTLENVRILVECKYIRPLIEVWLCPARHSIAPRPCWRVRRTPTLPGTCPRTWHWVGLHMAKRRCQIRSYIRRRYWRLGTRWSVSSVPQAWRRRRQSLWFPSCIGFVFFSFVLQGSVSNKKQFPVQTFLYL